MTAKITLLPSARADIADIVRWYVEIEQAVAVRFQADLDKTVTRVRANPYLFQRLIPAVRRALMSRFPYFVYFRILPTEIEVFAVLHNARDPETWQHRH